MEVWWWSSGLVNIVTLSSRVSVQVAKQSRCQAEGWWEYLNCVTWSSPADRPAANVWRWPAASHKDAETHGGEDALWYPECGESWAERGHGDRVGTECCHDREQHIGQDQPHELGWPDTWWCCCCCHLSHDWPGGECFPIGQQCHHWEDNHQTNK